MKILHIHVLVLSAALLAVLPNHSDAQQRTERVVVAPVTEGSQPGVIATRQQLDDQVRRFADRYHARMSIAVDRMHEYPLTPDQFQSAQYWRTMSRVTAVDIAIGRNAVTNLLDMMVLTSLGRMVIEEHWVPERFGEEFGQPLLDAGRALERDIWNISGAVLTSEQQAEMLMMISNYRSDHPEQVNPWWIRMDQFSGQRAARLNAVRRTGGLLREVRRARETAEEIQETAERALFYTQRAPGIVTDKLETGVLQMLSGPQVTQMVENSDRFIDAVEQLVQVFEEVSAMRLAAIDQLMEGLTLQRQALLNEFPTASPEAREMLRDLRTIVESGERISATLDAGEPVDIAEYRALAADVSQTTIERTKLIDAVGDATASPEGLVALVDQIAAGQERVLNRLLVVLLVSIAFFFVCLSGYRYATSKITASQRVTLRGETR